MKCYIDNTGRLHRTQAEAKASGRPFEVEIVPNDQQSLIDYINKVRDPVREPEGTEAPETPGATPSGNMVYTSPDQLPPHKNGDTTYRFMGSRNPEAIFMCVHCGRQNHNTAER